jgi:hypothetical protein
MADAPKQGPPLRLQTPEAVLSFPSVFVPVSFEDGPPKFSAVFVFTPEDQKSPAFLAMQKAVNFLTLQKYKGDATAAKAAIAEGLFRLPWRSNWKEKGYPEGSVFFTARSNPNNPPGIVGARADPATGKPVVITEAVQKVGHEHEVYSGCRVRGLVKFYTFDKIGKGVGVALLGLQKLGEGARLDNRIAAEDAFEAILSDTPAALDDMGADGMDDLLK